VQRRTQLGHGDGGQDEERGELRDPTRPGVTRQLVWLVIGSIMFAGANTVDGVGLPAPDLLMGLGAGLLVALSGLGARTRVALPRPAYLAAQAIVGVLLGMYFSLSSLTSDGWNVVPLIAITLFTLVLSVLAGLWLSRRSRLDGPTATLGMIAGGSTGIVAAGDDLGADTRVVAVLQYVRLLLVVASAPVLVRFVLAPSGAYASAGPKEIEADTTLAGIVFTLAVAAIGAAIALRGRAPSGALIGPLVLSAVLISTGKFHGVEPPEWLREPAFILIGLHVGLGFDREVVRRVARLAPQALPLIVGLIAACGLLAWLLSLLTSTSLLNAYLATTPGGINAVVVTAFSARANTSLVFGIQGLRLVLMVLAAPPLVAWLLRRNVADRPV
jgi:membrane AbrB-like protein